MLVVSSAEVSALSLGMSVGWHCLSSVVGFSGPLLLIVPSLKHGSSRTALSGAVFMCAHGEYEQVQEL